MDSLRKNPWLSSSGFFLFIFLLFFGLDYSQCPGPINQLLYWSRSVALTVAYALISFVIRDDDGAYIEKNVSA